MVFSQHPFPFLFSIYGIYLFYNVFWGVGGCGELRAEGPRKSNSWRKCWGFFLHEIYCFRHSIVGPWKRGVWDSGFKFQTDMGFRIQISNRAGFRIQILNFKVAGIQDSNFKWVGFRIQIISSGALQLPRSLTRALTLVLLVTSDFQSYRSIQYCVAVCTF